MANTKNFGKQIGYLAVDRKKYPIVMGHNKIGRHPEFCSIVLNTIDISRQHALINILDKYNYTIMDLGSLNKTVLNNESTHTLEPFIPYPLKDGNTIVFGATEALFKLLEDMSPSPIYEWSSTSDLSMDQSCDPAVVVPESSGVSDKDDSGVVPSQSPKHPEPESFMDISDLPPPENS